MWPDTFVTDDVLIHAVSVLRKAFDDDPQNPRFIQTIARRGYRLLVTVSKEEPKSRYRLLSKLGQGAMAEVHLAEDSVLRRKVALKFVLEEKGEENGEDGASRKRLLREARAAAGLESSQVCNIYDAGEVDGKAFIAMEYIQGQTLTEKIADGPLSMEEALRIAIDIASGLEAAHKKGLIHRDLKPSNVMVTSNGDVKVLDFGLAKRLYDGEQTRSQEESLASLGQKEISPGTLAYMSPEQIQGRDVDARSDIFSLAVVLFEMLTGKHPFKKTAWMGTATAIASETPPELSEYSEVPESLGQVLERMLAKDRDQRFQSMEEVRANLSQILTEPGKQAPSRKLVKTRLKYLRLNWQTGLMAGIVLASALLVYVGWKNVSPGSTGPPVPAIHKKITYTGNASYPAESPDGQFIAYVETVNEGQIVKVLDSSSGESIEVFRDRWCRGLRWSPDGTRLLIVSAARGSPGPVYVVPRLGGKPTEIGTANNACWSPDGRQIALSEASTPAIELVNRFTAETSSIQISGEFEFIGDIDWSPVANLLLYQTVAKNANGLWTIRPEGTEQKKILERGTIYSPRWSLADESIYYLVEAGAARDLWKISIDDAGENSREASYVVHSGLESYRFSLSGNRLLYGRVAAAPDKLWLVKVSDPEGNKPVEVELLTSSVTSIMSYDISPDGKWVVYQTVMATGKSIIRKISTDGTMAEDLVSKNSRHPAWSPDGKYVAFVSGGHVWKVGAEGGVAEQFSKSSPGRDTREVVWSPGRYILYRERGSQNGNFRVLDPESGEERSLVPEDSAKSVFFLRYSSDGSRVAVTWNTQVGTKGIWITTMKDLSMTQVYKPPDLPVLPTGWSPDGKWIYARKAQEPEKLLKISADGSGATPWLTLPIEDLQLRVPCRMSPDAKKMVCISTHKTSDIWSVENFDPEERPISD